MLVSAVGLTLLGCGGSTQTAGTPTTAGESAPTERATTGPDSDPQTPAVRPLPRPLYARCGVEGFAPPAVTPKPQVGGWRVLYTYPKRAPRAASPDDTTLLSIEERPPSSMPVHYSKHPRHIRVGRRTVEVYAGQGVLVGQWTSARARYVAIMNGARAERRLREVITCVP